MSSLLDQLHQFMDTVFTNETLVPEEIIREQGKEVVAELKKQGFVLRDHWADKNARSIFVKIQESSERKAVDELNSQSGGTGSDESMRKAFVSLQETSEKKMVDSLVINESNKLANSIWIIHTPTIATPCVTDGTPTGKLMAEEILKDEQRMALTLSRAHIIRDYLKAGGVLVIAYNAKQKQDRTAEQLAIYNKLLEEFPKQLIDFPMDLKEPYPNNLIGATYIMEDSERNKFEMTNLGVQANAPKENATWGVWMQNRKKPSIEANKRLCEVFSFLSKSGLAKVLDHHAQKYQIDPDQFAALLARYMSFELDPEKGTGCKVQ